MKLTRELINLSEAKNHLGETVYSSFPSWKAACRKADASVWFDGDIDICNAFVGTKPYKRGETRAIGEWDGAEGSLFVAAAVSEEMVPLNKIKPGQTLRWVEDGEEKIGKVVADPKYNGGMRIGGRSVKNIFDQGSTTELEIVKEGKVSDAVGKIMGVEPKEQKYKVGQTVKYEANPSQPDWDDGGTGEGKITAYKNGHYIINGKPVNHFEIKKVVKESTISESKENPRTAEQLDVGDVVVISGKVNHKDDTGEITRFDKDKKFVVVKLYKDDKEYSFHTSDVSEETSDEDDEETETFFVAIYDEDERTHWVGEVSKANGTKWHESEVSGKPDYRWGQTYMSYLSPHDVMSWIRKDYNRGYEVAGPFDSQEEADEYVERNFGGQIDEQSKSYTDFDVWKKAILLSYPTKAKAMKFKGRMEGGKDTISAEVPGEDRCYGVWDQQKEAGVVLSEDAHASAVEWFKKNKPKECQKCGFTSFYRTSTGSTQKIVCARCGEVAIKKDITEGASANDRLSARAKELLPRLKGPFKKKESVVNQCANLAAEYYNDAGLQRAHSIEDYIKSEMKKRGITEGVEEAITEGKWTVNARTGAKLDPRSGRELPMKLKEPKTPAPRAPAGPRRDENGFTKADYNVIWRKVEDVVSNIFPDGDPIDWMAPWLKKQGVSEFRVGEVIDKAAKQNGYKDMYAYWNELKTGDYGY